MTEFEQEVVRRLEEAADNEDLVRKARDFMNASTLPKYSYNFFWQGRPIIQYPQDIVAMQELIWQTRPDLIIETGIAHGGSLIFSASMLALLDYYEAASAGTVLDPAKPRRTVLGIDIDIRAHNSAAIEAHPLANRVDMIQGSSVAADVIAKVRAKARSFERILVCLDSNHTHDHVMSELEAYASLTSLGSYCVVFDTIIEDQPDDMYPNRPWCVGNNPKTAVYEFLKSHSEFEIDRSINHKLMISVAPDGFLKRIA